MSEQRHIIKRQIIELHSSSRQTASATQILQAEMSRIYRQRIVPLIDQVCSELSQPDRIYRLASVQIDLGTVDPHNLEVEVVAKVQAQLRQVLASEIGRQEQAVDQQTESLQSRSQLELLAVFARTGSLPWWADTSQPNLLTTCLQHLLQTAPIALRRLLRELVQEKRPLHRLILSFADTHLAQLVNLLIPTHQSDLQTFIQLLARSWTANNKSAAQIRQAAWTSLLSVGGLAQPEWTDVIFYTAVCNRMARALGITSDTFLYNLYQQTVTVDLPLAGIPVQVTNQPIIDNQPDADADVSAFNLHGVEELYVANAGLVILWPFLSHFFARLNLLQERAFKDGQAQQRAAALLQCLVTGEKVFPEYVLPLNKLLCGLALTAVFDMNAPLSTAEIEECTDLLQATIAQAPILRQMSAHGFRETFLQREGVLRSRDGGWLLQVEKETYDVVLERFPWSWEWVKLPWMETALRVEWL
jgi:hypothetical protein